ncbi:gag-pol polyprotein [Tanacetum coccineum]
MSLAGIGTVDTPSIALSDVYYIPSLTMNLAYVSKICDSRCDVKFYVSDCSIYDRKTQDFVGTGHRQGDLYVFDHFRDIHTTSSSVDLSSFWLNRSFSAFYLWHSRLGHVSGSRLWFLASTRAIGKLDTHDISDCSDCKHAKFSALPFSDSVSSSNALFDLMHSDVWGPSPISTKGDNLQQNGVSKKKHRHLVETTISFLVSANVPSVFWGEANLTATYVINRIPTAHNSGLSPFEKFSFSLFIAYVHRLHEHVSYREVVCDPLWQVVMVEELVSLHQTQTWDLVPLLFDKHVIGSRWVYKIKTKFDRSIETYKASLVSKGYAQEYGTDYEETFALVAKMTMAPRAWYEKFSTVVTSLGFVSSHHDSALFVKCSSARRLLSYFLGIEVPSSPKGYILSQSKYIADLLDHGTQFQTLLFSFTSALDLRAYCDSDWAGDFVSRKSTTGFPEYRAMVVPTSEIIWLHWLLADMSAHISRSTPLHYDNCSVIQIARNSVFHE